MVAQVKDEATMTAILRHSSTAIRRIRLQLSLAGRLTLGRCATVAVGIAMSVSAAAAQQSSWVQMKGVKATISLDQTIFVGKRTDSSAFRNESEGRRDWIQAGTLAMPEPNITLVITRTQDSNTTRYSIIRNLEDLAELKSTQKEFKPVYYDLATWLGTLRSVLFEVNADGVLKHCVGFHKPGTSKVNLKGFFCAVDQEVVAPERVACLVDKLRFVNPEDDGMVRTMLGPESVGECGAKRLEPTSRPATSNGEGPKQSL